MKTITRGILMAAIATAGCTQNGAHHPNDRSASANTSQNPNSYRMMTGSHIPQPTNRPFYGNLSATAPYDSSAREGFSLVPTEPTVGAGSQSVYRQNEPSTGAGPEGEPTARGATGSTVPGSTPSPRSKTTHKPKPKATPTPTPN